MHYIETTGIRFKQTSETVCTDGRVPDEIRKRVPDFGSATKKDDGRKISVELAARYCNS